MPTRVSIESLEMNGATNGRPNRGRRSAILTYHSLDESGSVISVRPETFRRQMEILAESRIPVVPLAEVRRHPGAVAITFDDGFANLAEHAVPVLERFLFPATIFVVSGYCGRRNNWPTQPPGVPQLSLMSWQLLRDLPATISLGAHTVTHPDLTALDDDAAAREVLESRDDIEQNTSRPVEAFAYPYGRVDRRCAALVRGKFCVACGTRLHFASLAGDPALLPRLDMYYLQSPKWLRDPFHPPTSTYIAARRWIREARAWTAGI
jgi:peptidoglycan/xylan/chitin deacetylase (PgdA/CDA1 family)